MVIVDVRASGGRGDTGIPTDAYFAVEEIRDVSVVLYHRTYLHADCYPVLTDSCQSINGPSGLVLVPASFSLIGSLACSLHSC